MPNSNIKILVTKLVCFHGLWAEYQDLKVGGLKPRSGLYLIVNFKAEKRVFRKG